MSCCGGSTVGRLIKDVDKLPDYLLADRDHIYRKPDKSMWVLNQDNNGYDPLNEDRVLHTQDTSTVKHTWDSNTQTLKSDVQMPNLISSDVDNSIVSGTDGKLFVKQAHGLYNIKFVQPVTGALIAQGIVLGQKVKASGKTFMAVRGHVTFDTAIRNITPIAVTYNVVLEDIDTGATLTGYDAFFSAAQNVILFNNNGFGLLNVTLSTSDKTGIYLTSGLSGTTSSSTTLSPLTAFLV